MRAVKKNNAPRSKGSGTEIDEWGAIFVSAKDERRLYVTCES